MPTPSSKKTKNDLLEEYNKLLAKNEELQQLVKVVNSPQSAALLSQAADYTVEQLTQSINNLKAGVDAPLRELGEKLIAEAQKFNEIQKAISIAKQNLELHYHIQVAAETLEQLIQEHKTKTNVLEEEITAKRRQWLREQEEHEYDVNLKVKRLKEEFVEIKNKQDQTLKEREELLKRQEQDAANLRAQVAVFPNELEKALNERERETAKRLHSEFEGQLTSAKKDWSAQEQLYKLTIKNLDELSKDKENEIMILKDEIEKANKRVQELTVKIIESGTRAPAKSEEQKS